MLEQRGEVGEVRVARLLYGEPGTIEGSSEALLDLSVSRMWPEEDLEALVPALLRPPGDQPVDVVGLVRLIRRRVPRVEHDRPGRIESEAPEQPLVLGLGAPPVVDVRLWPPGHRHARGIDAVEALEIAPHDLVLDDVAVEVGREHSLADLVIPAGDVPDTGSPRRRAASMSGIDTRAWRLVTIRPLHSSRIRSSSVRGT